MPLTKSQIFLLCGVLLCIVQIPYLVAPPAGPMLFWRKALTNMITENLGFEDGTMLISTVDHRDPDNRAFAGEFPIYNLVIASLMKVFGFAHNYGRYITLLAYLSGLYAFYTFLLEEGRANKEAILAVSVLAISSWFTHATRIMPDLFATSSLMVGVLFGARYLRSSAVKYLLGYAICVTFGGLSKMPVLMVLGFLALPFFISPNKNKIIFAFTTIVTLVPAVIWYFWWVPTLSERGANMLMFPTSLGEGFNQVFITHLHGTLKQFLYYIFNNYILIIPALAGFILCVKRENWFWLGAFLGSLPLLLLLMLKSGATFSTHYYYVIPIVPLFCGFAAISLAKLPMRISVSIVLLGTVLSMYYKATESVWTPKSYLQVAATVDRLDPTGGPIASAYDHDPRFSYYARRETYALWPRQLYDHTKMEHMIRNGAKLLVVPTWQEYADGIPYEKLLVDEHATYYRISQ